MKINPDHLSVVRPDALREAHAVAKSDATAATAATAKSGGSFENILASVAAKAAAQEQAAKSPEQLPGAGAAMHLTAAQLLLPPSKSLESEAKAMDNLDNLLLQWENYARQLAAEPHGLRHAHDTLNRISSQIGELKANWSQEGFAAAPGSGLKGMLNELDVLAVTERIKFDRGDYI
jgi:hypothetical protein